MNPTIDELILFAVVDKGLLPSIKDNGIKEGEILECYLKLYNAVKDITMKELSIEQLNVVLGALVIRVLTDKINSLDFNEKIRVMEESQMYLRVLLKKMGENYIKQWKSRDAHQY